MNRSSWLSRVGVAGLVIAGSVAAGSSPSGAASSQVVPTDVVAIAGSGEDLQLLEGAWGDAFGSSNPMTVDFQSGGSVAGRKAALDRSSGLSFAVTTLGTSTSGTVSAPITVSGLSYVLGTQNGGVLGQIIPPATEDDPIGFTPLAQDAFNLPYTTLARTLLGRPGELANDADVVAANGGTALTIENVGPLTPRTLVRSDADTVNAATLNVARSVDGSAIADGGVVPTIPEASETWPSTFPNTALPRVQGEASILATLTLGAIGTIAESASPASIITPLSPSTAQAALALTDATANPPRRMYPVAVQNGRGQWVTATSESLTKAAAGAAAANANDPDMLWAMSDTSAAADGAYPLAWQVNLQAPTSGLSAAEANAVATLIRYLVSSAGQDVAVAANHGRLPASQIKRAQAAANQIVSGNCAALGGTVTTVANGGPYWPSGVASESVTLCAVASTTTTTASTTTTTAASSSTTTSSLATSVSAVLSSAGVSSGSTKTFKVATGVGGFALGFESAPAVVESETATAEGGSSATKGNASTKVVPAAATLPLGLPANGRGQLDQLVTILLGAGLVILARTAVFRRRKAHQ